MKVTVSVPIFESNYRLTKENIIGRQYGSRSSALRAIRKVTEKVKPGRPALFCVNQIDVGCYEVL
jgi:hypothetical protein